MRPARRRAHRQIRTEGSGIRTAFALLIALSLVGCTGSPRPKQSETKKPESKDASRIDEAQTGGGSATRWSEGEGRKRLWSVEWGEATIEYNQKGQFGGEMSVVKGTIFREGVETATFTARQASAAFGTNRLEIAGGIELTSKEPKLTLRAGKVVWDPELDRIEASGTVTIEAERYSMGPFDRVYASPNLDEIGSPEMFRKTP